MAYQEKYALVFGIIAVLAYGVYIALVAPQLASAPLAELYWVAPMLWSIGGAIVAGIVAAVESGALPASRLDEAAGRVTTLRLQLAGDGRGMVPCGDCAPAE